MILIVRYADDFGNCRNIQLIKMCCAADGERKSSCGVCGARLGPGVAQAHFLQELQHLYSLSALPRDAAAPPTHSLHHQDEDARWEVCASFSLVILFVRFILRALNVLLG